MKDELKEKRNEKELKTIMDTDITNAVTDMCVKLFNIKFKGQISQEVTIETESGKEVKFNVTIETL